MRDVRAPFLAALVVALMWLCAAHTARAQSFIPLPPGAAYCGDAGPGDVVSVSCLGAPPGVLTMSFYRCYFDGMCELLLSQWSVSALVSCEGARWDPAQGAYLPDYAMCNAVFDAPPGEPGVALDWNNPAHVGQVLLFVAAFALAMFGYSLGARE